MSFVDGLLVTFTLATFLTVLGAIFLFGLLEDHTQAVTGLAIALGAGGVVTLNDPNRVWSDFAGLVLIMSIAWLAGFAIGRKLEQASAAQARAELEREEQAWLPRRRGGARADRPRAARRRRAQRQRDDGAGRGRAPAARAGPGQGTRGAGGRRADRSRGARRDAAHGRRAAPPRRGACAGAAAEPRAPRATPLHHARGRAARRAEDRGHAGRAPAGAGHDCLPDRPGGFDQRGQAREGRPAEVLVRYGNGTVELVVSDDGRGNGDGGGSGHGLVGMRERVSVYGGELEAGPQAGGGFRLRATLPVT